MKRIKIKIPATSANLGPGFDVAGAALTLYNEMELALSRSGGDIPETLPRFIIEGEGKDCIPVDRTNLVWQAMEATFRALRRRGLKRVPYGIESIRCVNHIPLASGLGSSAAALLGGILAANEVSGEALSETEIMELGVSLEGHPDNIVPAITGGLSVSIIEKDGRVRYIKLAVPKGITALVCHPDFKLPTEKARRVIPQKISRADAIFTSGRLALLVAALQTRDFAAVGAGMQDVLHQPYRMPLVPGMQKVFEAGLKAGAYGAALSGAGPSIIALCPAAACGKTGRAMQTAWKKHGISSRCYCLKFDMKGAQIVRQKGVR